MISPYGTYYIVVWSACPPEETPNEQQTLAENDQLSLLQNTQYLQ